MTVNPSRFTVDTHLFRELGELLVGRDSTALIELVKNSYDADATAVTVYGEELATGTGHIIVADDGTGMTREIFEEAFLRIASRYKEMGDRRSNKYHRRYTGAKGIGRLSAHKLARELRLSSVPDPVVYGQHDGLLYGVRADIDWEAMETEHDTLDDVGSSLRVESLPVSSDARSGTALRLLRLRHAWTSRQLGRFLEEVRTTRPAPALIDSLPRTVIRTKLLFDSIPICETTKEDPGFRLDLQGDFEPGDDLWPTLLERMQWLLEIHATPDGVDFAIGPTVRYEREHPHARVYRLRREHPDPKAGPFFSARIFCRVGSIGQRERGLTRFARTSGGTRVYMEGFRVLPYGEQGNDWLDLDRDAARKPRDYDVQLDPSSRRALPTLEQEGFYQLGSASYYGGIFLTANQAPHLESLVNREGFVPGPSLDILTELVRNGIDLTVRARASLAKLEDAEKRANLNTEAEDLLVSVPSTTDEPQLDPGESRPADVQRDSSEETAAADSLGERLAVVSNALARVRLTLQLDVEGRVDLDRADAALRLAVSQIDEARDEQAMLRILAGVGTQFAAFIHEINGLLGQAQALRSLVNNLRDEGRYSPSQLRLIAALDRAVDGFVQALARQSSYLTDVIGPDARRRRRRLRVDDSLESALRLVASSLSNRDIKLETNIPEDVRTPPMFPAELVIILTNLLTNAIKAAGDGGKILVSAYKAPDAGTSIRVENTGSSVDLDDAERWFRPFESTTTDVDVVLGQGMGLGLPITRRLVTDYDGEVHFVPPSDGYATAVEVILPERKGAR
jgi:signal transduction histidine kinase